MSKHITALLIALGLLCGQLSADTHVRSLRKALDGRSWMAQQAEWPCFYRGSLQQQRDIAGSEQAVRSSGRFWFDCRRGLIWQLDKPRVEVRVHTASRNDLVFNGRNRVRALNGLVEQRIGLLMRSIFSGDMTTLADDFALTEVTDETVRLVPRDTRAAAHIAALVLGGNEQTAYLVLEAPETSGDSLTIDLTDFAQHSGKSAECTQWLSDDTSACDALRSPLRYLQR